MLARPIIGASAKPSGRVLEVLEFERQRQQIAHPEGVEALAVEDFHLAQLDPIVAAA